MTDDGKRAALDAADKPSHPRSCDPSPSFDPKVEALVEDVIGRVADKWTLLVLETLEAQGTLRFTELSRLIGTISQKMLTQTLRGMERDGLVTRTIHPVVPPHVDYALTDLGRTLGAAFCGVWVWAADNLERIEAARSQYDALQPPKRPPTMGKPRRAARSR